MLRLSLQDKLFAVTAGQFVCCHGGKRRGKRLERANGVHEPRVSCSKKKYNLIYRVYGPRRPYPMFHGVSSQFTMSLISKQDTGPGSKQALDYTAS